MASGATAAKVPVAEVAASAYRSVFGRLSLFFDLAWLPLLITLLAAILPGYLRFYGGLGPFPHWIGDDMGFGIEALIEAVVGFFCLNAFAVRWHQTLLVPRSAAPPPFIGPWLRFLLYTALFYLFAAALVALLFSVNDDSRWPVGIAAIALWLVPVRCSLLFPAAACSQPLSFAAAWRALRGNLWRLLGCGFAACMPAVFIAALILSGVFAGFHLDRFGSARLPPGFFILYGVIKTCLNFIVMALGASVLALFYRHTVRSGAPQLGGATAPGRE
jgi:hypothetical protein